MNIVEALRSDAFFKPLFKDLETWHSWEVYLQALFGLPIEDGKDRKLFEGCTGLKHAPEKRSKESYVIVGRRGGKSFISSICSVYMAIYKDWTEFLSPGERGYIFIIANDKVQAKIIKNYISGFFKSNPSFNKLVSKDLTWEIELKNQISIMVKTCDFRTIRGYTILLCILEEMAFYRSEYFANPGKEIRAAVLPSLATIPDSMLLGISSPYSRSGILYQMHKKYYGKPEGPLIWKAKSTVMNPTINRSIIEDAYKEDPAAARAEWGAEWRADIEAFMPPEFIEAVVIPGRYELPKIKDTEYFGFADPSGGRLDSFTLGISHKDKEGRVILDVIRERRPPFKPSEVVEEFSNTLKDYGITQIESDRYGAEWITESFKKHEIEVKNSDLSASEIYLSFLPIVANGTVELLDNKRLKSQLAGLERRTRAGGKDLITHYPGGHDDMANSAAGVCVMASRNKGQGFICTFSKRDVY